jgi:Ca2+-binding RTX toxin-like protein
MIVHGLGGDDDIQAAGSISTPLWLYGDDGNDRLKGGDGPSVLMGGAGDDTLMGGSGAALLIGGLGSDTLNGDPGSNIMIGGTTDFDANDAALAAIMNEWTRTDETYQQRVNNITGATSGGVNGSYFLNSSTVHDDHTADKLQGGAGLDLFFLSLLDKATGTHSDESIIPI